MLRQLGVLKWLCIRKESGGTVEALCMNPEKLVTALTVRNVIHGNTLCNAAAKKINAILCFINRSTTSSSWEITAELYSVTTQLYLVLITRLKVTWES